MFPFSKRTIENDAVFPATLDGRSVRVYLSKAAQLALEQCSAPLIAEMELYFSCLIRFQVRFHESADVSAATPISDKLAICFRPVAGRRCDLHAVGDTQPLDDFPIVNRSAYVPHWLRIDYRNGEWLGRFGYRNAPA